MCHWGPSPLLTMALSFTDYTMGSPITPGVNYKVVVSKAGAHAYLLTCSVADAVLQLTETQPADNDWSNVETYVANGAIAGRIFPLSNKTYYFRVSGPPSLAYDSTLAIKDLDLQWPADITPKAIPTDGSPITSGFYSLDALSLSVGKFHSFSIVPAKSGNLVGKHETSDQHQFVATIFGVNAQGCPVSHMTSFANTEQSIFNFDTAKAILHLSAPEGAEFNYTCSIASFSSGSEGSLTPSSDANITGAWVFSNTISVPAPTAQGHAANKEYVDAAIEAIPVFNPAEAQIISGSWNFTNGLTRMTKASPVNTDIMNKQMSDALYVPASGNTTIAGTKTFSDGITLGDEKLLTLGIGANAMKIHGSGTGAAVIEGANGTSLDVAVPTDFSEPVTFQGAVSYPAPGTSETIVSSWSGDKASYELRYRGSDGVLRMTLKGGGKSIFSCGRDGYMFSMYKFAATTLLVFDSSTFNAGVTMGQTLTVAGVTTLNNDLVLNPSNGGPTISASGETVSWTQLGNTLAFQIQGTNATILFSGSASSANVDIQKPDAQILTATSLMNQGESDGRYLKLAGGTVTGATTFNAGVTMAQSLNCSSTLQVASHLYVGDSIQTNTDLGKFTFANLKFQNTADSTEDLQLLTDTGGVYIRIARENFYMASADPDPTDVLSVREMDARYAKVVSLTKAAYTALATKDPTTIYLITDTTPRMCAIGDMKIVTADVPA